MGNQNNNPLVIAVVVLALLLVAVVIWKVATPDGPPNGKGIPRSDGLSDQQREGMAIMNKAGRPDVQGGK